MKKCGVIIVAAGRGERFGKEDKLYLKLGEMPVILHSVFAFTPFKEIRDIVLVVRKEKISQANKLIKKYRINKKIKVVGGADIRMWSVYEGLKALNPDIEHVLIHDGARPLITEKIIRNCLREMKKSRALLVAVPSKDTVKEAENLKVKQTLKRERIYLAQTPQVFKFKDLWNAYQLINKKEEFTDDSSLIEKFGIPVKIVYGSYENIKITTYEDLVFAQTILKKRRKN